MTPDSGLRCHQIQDSDDTRPRLLVHGSSEPVYDGSSEPVYDGSSRSVMVEVHIRPGMPWVHHPGYTSMPHVTATPSAHCGARPD